MPIKFYLQPNPVTPDPNDQVGSELKFNPSNAEEGIYLTHEIGTETKVTELAIRTESKLMFTICTGVLQKQLQII